VIAGAGGNVVVWSGTDGVVLVDTGLAASSAALVDAVTHVSAAPVRFVINTNGHADHVGGNDAFARKGAVVIGHESLREDSGRDPAVPDGNASASTVAPAARPMLTIMEALALHLNGDRLDAVHVADAHTSADIVVRWNDADVVALGDIYWNGQYPYIDVESGGSLAGTVAAIEAALARSNARTVVIPGHGPVSNRAELAAYRDMLVAVGRKVREAVEKGEGIEGILAAKPTADFDARFGRPGALVTPQEFVRSIYRDLAPKRPGR
jgi:glyoxylase-like metal-dependent hydrolase (beta-lactamase superfamily II)